MVKLLVRYYSLNTESSLVKSLIEFSNRLAAEAIPKIERKKVAKAH